MDKDLDEISKLLARIRIYSSNLSVIAWATEADNKLFEYWIRQLEREKKRLQQIDEMIAEDEFHRGG